MVIPIETWLTINSAIQITIIIGTFYYLSKIIRNIQHAFRKEVHVHNHIKLENCSLVKPEDL